MKICIIAYKFGTEKEIGLHLGTYHYFIEILRNLVKGGHEVTVIAPWVSFTNKGSEDVNGVKVIRYFPPMFNRTWAYPVSAILRNWYIKATQKKVIDFDKKNKPDTYLVWQARETGFALAQIKEKLQAPYLFRQITTWQWHFERSIEDIFGQKKIYKFFKAIKLNKIFNPVLELLLGRKAQKKYAKAIYEKADKVIFVSEIASKEGIEMGLNQDKVEILPVSIDIDLFKPLNKKDELRNQLGLSSKKIILFIGRINFAEKGIGYLLEATAEIKKNITDVKLVIIGGGGEEERLKTKIQELKIENNVKLAGKKPFGELPKYINASDILVVPSVWMETFGQVTIEAMSCGVPVVTYDAGASPYINIDNQTGFVVPAKDSQKLASAISRLLSDSELAQKFGQAGRQRVKENYTYEVVVNKLLTIMSKKEYGKSQ